MARLWTALASLRLHDFRTPVIVPFAVLFAPATEQRRRVGWLAGYLTRCVVKAAAFQWRLSLTATAVSK
jgi:hypothetical protein